MIQHMVIVGSCLKPRFDEHKTLFSYQPLHKILVEIKILIMAGLVYLD